MGNQGTSSIFSDDEHNELTQRAKDDASFDGDFDELDELEDEDELELETVDQIIRRLKTEQDIDIFQDVGEKLASNDMIVTYQIKKNGKFFTTKTHPYSWEELQREFCKQEGARFSITAKNPDSGAYIKTQTQNVDKLPDNGQPNVEASSQERGMSTQELLALIQKQDEKAKREASEKSRSERETMITLMQAMKPERQDNSDMIRMISEQSNNSSNTIVALMTAMMQNKPQDNSGDMLKFMVELQNKQQERTERMIEKMSENTNKVLEQVMMVASHKEEPEFKTFDVMQMVDKARTEGFEQFNTMNQLAEMKAKERADMVGKRDPEGITETILKSLAPALASGIMAGRGQQQAPLPQQRGSLPQTTNNRQVRPQQRTATGQGQRRPAQQTSQGGATRSTNGSGGQSRPSSFPSVTKKVVPAEVHGIKTGNKAQNTSSLEQKAQSGKMVVDEGHKELVLQVAVPIVMESYQATETVEQTVEKTVQAFLANGVQMERAMIDFTASDIEGLITHFGLDESMSVLLREFYDKLHERIIGQYPQNG